MFKIIFVLIIVSTFYSCEKKQLQKIEDIWERIDTQEPPNDSIAEYWQFYNNVLKIEKFDLNQIPVNQIYDATFELKTIPFNNKLIIKDCALPNYNGEWSFYTFKKDVFAIYQFTYNDFFYMEFKQIGDNYQNKKQ